MNWVLLKCFADDPIKECHEVKKTEQKIEEKDNGSALYIVQTASSHVFNFTI